MSKYSLLWKYLKDNNKDSYNLSFKEIEDILGFNIDHSFLNYKNEAKEYNYIVSKIYLKKKEILFDRIR